MTATATFGEAAAPTLASAAYERVEALIVTHQLKPGAVFSEGELAAALEIGRTPLREALQRLASDGLVSSIPRRGMMIAPMDLPDMLSIIETRKPLDALIVAGVAKRASSADRQAIRQAHATLESLEPEAFMKADYELDRAIWAASPNQYAVQAVTSLHSHCRRFWYRYRNDQDLQRSSDLHDAVVEAILAGDPVAAVERSDKLLDYLSLFTKHILIAR